MASTPPPTLPLAATLSVGLPCILVLLGCLLYLAVNTLSAQGQPLQATIRSFLASLRPSIRTTADTDVSATTTQRPTLKPLILGLFPFRSSKSTLPRDFYGLPPRPSVSTTAQDGRRSKFSKVASRLGLGSRSAGGGETKGTASLPAVKPGTGLPGLDDDPVTSLEATSDDRRLHAIILNIVIASLIATIAATVCLSTGTTKSSHLALGIAVSVVPWTSFATAISARTNPRWTTSLALVVGVVSSVATGVCGAFATRWIVVGGSTVATIGTTAVVIMTHQRLTPGSLSLPKSLKSRFNRIRLPTATHDRSASASHRRKKVSDRMFKRDKEKSFFSGPAVIPESAEEGADGKKPTREVIKELQKRESWLESPSRHSSYAKTDPISSFSYSSVKAPIPPSPSTPSTSAAYSTASEGDNDHFSDAISPPARCVSRSTSQVLRHGNPAGGQYGTPIAGSDNSSPKASESSFDQTQNFSILHTSDPWDSSFALGPGSVRCMRAGLRERDGKVGGVRLTEFDMVLPPVPPLPRRMDSQYSVGNAAGDQSFPHSVSANEDELPFDVRLSTADETESRGPSLDKPRRSVSTSRRSFALSERLQRPHQAAPPLPDLRDRAMSPGACSTVYSPTTAGNKDSMAPLLMGGSVGTLLNPPSDDYRMRGASVDELMRMTDEVLLEAQIQGGEEDEARKRRMERASLIALVGVWSSWALSVPAQIPSGNEMAAAALLLTAVMLYTPLLAMCYLVLRPVLAANALHARAPLPPSARRPVSRLVLSSHPRSSEGLERIRDMPSRSLISSNDSPVAPRWSQLIRPQPSISQFGYRKSGSFESNIDAPQRHRPTHDSETDPKLLQKRMSMPSTEVWVETGQAKRHSGRLERIMNSMAPHPVLSIGLPRPRPVEQYEMQQDPQTTPRPSRRLTIVNKDPQSAWGSPVTPKRGPVNHGGLAQSEENYSWVHPSAILSTPRSSVRPEIDVSYGVGSQAGTPTSAKLSFDLRRQRGQSVETDADIKSVKMAKVHTAVRTKMSRPHAFDLGRQHSEIEEPVATGTTQDNFAPIGASARERRRFSALSFRSNSEGEDRIQRRRTFDLGRLLSGKNHPDADVLVPRPKDFELDWLSAGLIQGLVPSIKIGKHASFVAPAANDSPRARDDSMLSLSRRTSCSTSRPSMDIPPFRPSFDILPSSPNHGRSTSIDTHAARDCDFAEIAQESTPKRNIRRRGGGGHKTNRSLPSVPAGDLVEEVIEALDAYGRTKETPVRQFTRLQAADMRRKSPGKSILKKASTTLLSSDSPTHDMPPLPANLDALIEEHEARKSPRAAKAKQLEESLAAQDDPTTPRASRANVTLRNVHPLPSLSTVSERSAESGNSTSTRRAKLSISTERYLEATAAAGPALPADDDEIIEEMEMVLSMDSPTTADYMASTSGTASRPVSLDGGDSWLLRPSKSSLSLSGGDDIRGLATKKSSDTVATTATNVSSVQSAPSPSPSPVQPRSSLILHSGTRSKARASMAPTAQHRHSYASGDTVSATSAGLRPLMLLGEKRANEQVSRPRAEKLAKVQRPVSVATTSPSEEIKLQSPPSDPPATAKDASRLIPTKTQVRRNRKPVPSVYADENAVSAKQTPKQELSGRSTRAGLSSSSPRKRPSMTNMR